MVQQRGLPLQQSISQGDFFPQRQDSWNPREQDRGFYEAPSDPRYQPPQSNLHGRCLTIEAALKGCAGIAVKEFALLVHQENGEHKYFSSTSLAPYRESIFTSQVKNTFRQSVRRAETDDGGNASFAGQESMYGQFDLESGQSSRKQSRADSSDVGRRHRRRNDESEDDVSSGTHKRAKIRGYSKYGRETSHSNDDTPVPVQKTQQLMIGDEAEVEKFYLVRFKDMQQSSCKVMGKAFVKLVEPKKQTHHPYTKGDDKAPPWWPKTKGENHVRHKEPDHLLKPERIRLLVHILRMIVKPVSQQHSTVQKLGLNVKKLEEITMEAMSNWFSDKDHPENLLKKPYLKEIFKIARNEERYLNGEIDGTTVIPVMYGEKSAVDDDSEPETEDLKDEDEEEIVQSAVTGGNMPTPESLVSPAIGQSQFQQLDHDQHIQQQIRRPGPARHQSYDNTYRDSYHRNEIGFQQPQSPGIQDTYTRPQVSVNTGYTSPQQQQIYWGSGMVSNAPAPSFYASSPQSAHPTTTAPYLPPPTAAQLPQQHMLPPPQITPHHYNDGLQAARTYDTAPALGQSLRTGSIGHPHSMTPHAFEGYLHDNAGFGQHDPDMKDNPPNIHQS